MWYLHQFKKDENDNLNGWWEEGKTRIKEISLNFSKRKNRENKNYKYNLCKQFHNVKNKLDRDLSNANSKYLYNKINQEIKQVEILKAEGAKIRSKAQWREEGETSSRYFCSLEKKRGAEKSMRSVQRVKDGPIVTGTKNMLEQTRQFYVDYTLTRELRLMHKKLCSVKLLRNSPKIKLNCAKVQ